MINWNGNLVVIFLLLLLVFNFPVKIYAQDDPESKDLSEMSLEDLLNMEVTTASKKTEKSTDAPGIITTITKEEIKYFGATTIQEILQRAPSIQPFSSHLFGPNANIFRGDLRTLYNNNILILFNGRPVREGVSGGLDFPIYSGFPVDMIEKIEIVRGPGSVLYGSNAFVGVINIITKDNANSSNLEVRANGGSFGTINSFMNGAFIKDDLRIKIGAKLGNIKGWDYEAITAKPGSPNLPFYMKAGQKNLGFAADASYKGLSILGLYTHNQIDVLGILPYTPYKAKNKFSRLFLNAGYVYNISSKWEASLNGSYSGTDFIISDESLIPEDHHNATDFLGELSLSGEIAGILNLIVGAVLDSRNKNNIETGDAIKQPYHLTQSTIYAQTDYRPFEKLKLIAGAQVNKPENGDWDLVPRVGAIYNITGEVGLKVLTAYAFRSPWPIELFLDNPAVIGNPELTPEKINTTDVQLFYSEKSVDLSLTYFNSHYSNTIIRTPVPGMTGVVTYANQGSLNMHGFEFEGKTTIISDVFITGSATYQKNLDKDKTVYIPTFMGKIGTFFKPVNNLSIGLFNSFFGKPKENKGQELNTSAAAVDFLSFNTIYKLPIPLNMELSLNIQNLLNSEYNYTEMGRGWVNTLPMGPSRAAYVGLDLEF
ncbi:MAG: TonB-dependent receptor plug domain-containing protein [Ignavibacteria bacterium]